MNRCVRPQVARRRSGRRLAYATAALFAVCANALAAPPNILLLVAEDLSPRLGSYGDATARTPQLDAFAQRAVRFDRAFTTAGVCAPSRAAMIMGAHAVSFGAAHMRTSTAPLGFYLAQPADGMRAFPELLRAGGYYTFTDAKLDYQFSGIRAGSGPFTIWDAQGNGADWRGRDRKQPFFGLVNFMQTHESGVMATTGTPLDATHARTMAFRTQAGLNAPTITDPATLTLPPYYPDMPAVRADLARHYDNIAALDAQVARWFKRLDAQDLWTNTIVIVTADHGDGLPRAKRELYDSGLRVPLLIWLPERLRPRWWRAGTRDDRLISFVDLAPTLLHLAGLPAEGRHHGRNLLAAERRQYLYAARDRIDEVPDRQRAVRTERFKLIQSFAPEVPGGHPLAYRDLLASTRALRAAHAAGTLNTAQARWFEPAGALQLYDLERDPYELDNLADRRRYRRVQRRLLRALEQRFEAIGDLGALPEAELRTRLLGPDGELRLTPPPRVNITTKDSGSVVTLSGTGSIGYRLGDGAWRLYTDPVDLGMGQTLEAKAVRYGWRESESVVASGASKR
ncbi:MAG: sulfatase [Pseudomonadota bacterium]